jgi:hypothetical protein
MEHSCTEATASHGLPEEVADAWAAVVLDILEKDGDAEATDLIPQNDTGEPLCQPAI